MKRGKVGLLANFRGAEHLYTSDRELRTLIAVLKQPGYPDIAIKSVRKCLYVATAWHYGVPVSNKIVAKLSDCTSEFIK